jgi:hypothetical protein
MTTRTPEWLVERLHQGDLPPAEAAVVRARLSEEGGLGRLEALARDDARFEEAHPAAPAVAEIRRRAAERRTARPRPRRMLFVLVPMAAAAMAVVALRLPGPATRVGDDDVRLKGSSPHLAIHKQGTGGEPEALARGARVRAGEVLQLSIVSAGRPYGVIVSVDGRGVVTRHGPGDGALAAKLPAQGTVPLDHSYRLDDAPGFERFFLVTGRAPFPVEPVLDALRRLAAARSARTDAPALSSGLAWSDFVLEKAP